VQRILRSKDHGAECGCPCFSRSTVESGTLARTTGVRSLARFALGAGLCVHPGWIHELGPPRPLPAP